jgi:Domain of unknown function (DUF4136)
MKKILALLAVTCALAACESAPKIRANTAPGANLQSYKTYTFPAKLGTDRGDVQTPLTGYFKEAVRREMDARGYQFVEGGVADLWVNFHVQAQEKTDVRSTPAPYAGGYYGYRGGVYGGWGYGATEVETIHYKVGTCNIDVVDANKRQLVWEGVAEGKLTDKVLANPQAAVNAVVTQMYMQFPGTPPAVPAK